VINSRQQSLRAIKIGKTLRQVDRLVRLRKGGHASKDGRSDLWQLGIGVMHDGLGFVIEVK
jgi:hypothetical protein